MSQADVGLLDSLPAPLQRLLSPNAPQQLKAMAAKGVVPGAKAHQVLTVVEALSRSEDPELAERARSTLRECPDALLVGGLNADLPSHVAAALALANFANASVVQRLVVLPQLPDFALIELAKHGTEDVTEIIATNEERLLQTPAAIEALYQNRTARMSTANRLVELAIRNGQELRSIPVYEELVQALRSPASIERPTHDAQADVLSRKADELGQSLNPGMEDTHNLDPATGSEVVQPKFVPLDEVIRQMTVVEKIRRALIGSSGERLILVRDSNRMVAVAAIRSPSVHESEVLRVSANRNVCEDVLRVIALDREWTRHHLIKVNLVSNPRTPFALASRLVPHLRDHELRALTRSKNVPSAIVAAAKQQLARKGRT